MFSPHPVFEGPSNIDISIWRYMNLAKFVSMLQSDALHFARADQMKDEFEGSISKPTFSARREMLRRALKENADHFNDQIAHGSKQTQQLMYLNCWHMNEHESAAMWDLYLGGEAQGIAIRSTYKRLTGSITDQRAVCIGKVNYADFNTDVIPTRNAFSPYLYKRKSFEHERELRAIYLGAQSPSDDVPASPLGVEVVPIQVNLDRLVEEVYVSPKAPGWFEVLVRDLLQRYSRNWSLQHSSLDADPLY